MWFDFIAVWKGDGERSTYKTNNSENTRRSTEKKRGVVGSGATLFIQTNKHSPAIYIGVQQNLLKEEKGDYPKRGLPHDGSGAVFYLYAAEQSRAEQSRVFRGEGRALTNESEEGGKKNYEKKKKKDR
eukprot:gene795-437_t